MRTWINVLRNAIISTRLKFVNWYRACQKGNHGVCIVRIQQLGKPWTKSQCFLFLREKLTPEKLPKELVHIYYVSKGLFDS